MAERHHRQDQGGVGEPRSGAGMTDSAFPPFPTPDPVAVAQWASLGRHALTLGGGALAAFGISLPTWLASITDPQLNIIVSAAMFFCGGGMALVGVLKGRWDKWQARRVLVASTIASVQQGSPVALTVTPDGLPNDLTHISATEQAAAPRVPNVAPQPAPLVP